MIQLPSSLKVSWKWKVLVPHSGNNLQVERTFFPIRVGSLPLGSGREMIRSMSPVHLPPLLSLMCLYIIMNNSTPFIFKRTCLFLLLCKICKMMKSRRQPNRINILLQLLGNSIILLFVHLWFSFFKKGLFSVD